jgi:NAD(P)-dependent dehydrogenase (short-subunit alcohol dehydrogenase family)
MPDRAAIVTGASRGIGLALAEALGEDGYALTIVASRPETIEPAAEELRAKGFEVDSVATDLADEDGIRRVVRGHRDRYGRLDVLVNSAGVLIGAEGTKHMTESVDVQLGVNLRAIILFYRECLELLTAAAGEHRNAVVVNMASQAGRVPQPYLSVYGATKAAVIAYTVSMNREFAVHGVKSVAFCPGYVDTEMTDFAKEAIPGQEMVRISDLVEALRFVLRLSPACVVPEIVFERPVVPDPRIAATLVASTKSTVR